jgi:glycerophosphoryl diester phosphodiesterase
MVPNLFCMNRFLLTALALIGTAMTNPATAQDIIQNGENDLLIIAHRGASGERPEHTLAAYERAIDQGADYIEPDLVVTKDGVLVSRHENEISGTTDVADREEFEDRRRGKTIDGRLTNGWFVEDFTLEELRTLRAKERLPYIRPENARYDGLYQVPTFEEIVDLVRAKEAELGKRIGLYPELKHPNFLLQDEGIDSVDLLVLALKKAGYTKASDPIFIQCFEVGPLQRLNQLTDVRLVQLVNLEAGPADEPSMRYAEMVTPTGLADIAKYADGIGPHFGLVLNEDGSPTALVTEAHANALKVHPWTLRRENTFMPATLRSNDNPRGLGGLPPLMGLLVAAEVDGIFTDHPAAAVMLRESGNYEP